MSRFAARPTEIRADNTRAFNSEMNCRYSGDVTNASFMVILQRMAAFPARHPSPLSAPPHLRVIQTSNRSPAHTSVCGLGRFCFQWVQPCLKPTNTHNSKPIVVNISLFSLVIGGKINPN
jgi:hypothetical protein